MSYSTKPAFVHWGNFSDETQAHPAMKWMENYTRHYIDERKFYNGTDEDSKHHTEDFVLQKSDGTVVKGRENAIKALQEIYGPFAGQTHVPEFLVCWEQEGGYGMAGVANVYFKVNGLDGASVDGPEGGKWHGVCSGAFQFDYVKDGDSFKLKRTRIFSDSSPALKVMLKNNMINGDALAGMIGGA